jgi:hypothetical protein
MTMVSPGAVCVSPGEGRALMSTILIILLLILLLGGGGYYGHSRYGTAGLGGVLGLVLIVVVVLWLLGAVNLR